MRNEQVHLMYSGNSAHDIMGPISVLSEGPTLLMQPKAMQMALVLSMPATIIMVAVIKTINVKIAKKKAPEVDGVTGATFTSDAVKENVRRALEYYWSHK